MCSPRNEDGCALINQFRQLPLQARNIFEAEMCIHRKTVFYRGTVQLWLKAAITKLAPRSLATWLGSGAKIKLGLPNFVRSTSGRARPRFSPRGVSWPRLIAAFRHVEY